ncbi:hypothetical protein NHX12_033571 [Muraenolepis orangiensis]|uniref:Uncharacterized protein n=1 Tax=Muraenolepis orangiensis TaxID=630683 RepID=A0A9Q0E692_9TELE|nr:hypothetical protein NHX12_033571 [Muraenolepis orangiensis]
MEDVQRGRGRGRRGGGTRGGIFVSRLQNKTRLVDLVVTQRTPAGANASWRHARLRQVPENGELTTYGLYEPNLKSAFVVRPPSS